MLNNIFFFIPFFLSAAVFFLIIRTDPRGVRTGVFFVLSLAALFFAFYQLSYKYSKTIDSILPFAATVSSVSKIVMSVIGLVPTAMIIITVVYGVIVIKREGMASQNARTLGFGIILIIYTVVWPLAGGLKLDVRISLIYGCISLIVVYFIFLKSMYTMSSIINLIHRSERKDLDYLIIMGAGMKGDKADILMEGRLDKTYELWQSNTHSKVIITGGSEKSDNMLSVCKLAERLSEKGVPQDRIITDDLSGNTKEDIESARRIIMEERGFSDDGRKKWIGKRNLPTAKEGSGEKEIPDPAAGAECECSGKARNNIRIAVVSSNYHVLRSLVVAKKNKIRCIGYGASVRTDYRMNAFVNEYYNYLKVSKKFHLTIVGLIILLFIYIMYKYLLLH